MINSSPEIRTWLQQFGTHDVETAKSLLANLKFVSRDDYAEWVVNKLECFQAGTDSSAIYTVRKFRTGAQNFWRNDGSVQPRPATTQGSEDLAASIISNANRRYGDFFKDHPSLQVLKNNRIKSIILIDDSIGSGHRVSEFLKLMTNHPTFLSWWNYGRIHIHIIALARTRESEKFILENMVGSDHGKRVYRKSSKLFFHSDIVYNSFYLNSRWGKKSNEILNLCGRTKKIPKDRRRGYGDVMGNIVFYHSVPNNIPGMLFRRDNGWQPLFPDRSFPDWLANLLENGSRINTVDDSGQLQIRKEVLQILGMVKSGLRTKTSLSKRLGYDVKIVDQIMSFCLRMNLLFKDENNVLRIGEAGYAYLKRNIQSIERKREYDYGLYVPSTWSVD